ncbi:optic atrophy 3 protein homolog isoform X2 [Penaeus japonicus]|uniref:optic atrophy 3 protein homolog isoform X2 n=1 Tax=Penaeus japonicus TaxID=27405 RepID=UPI001C70F3D7|nr:optic atrophy 3 protein homolog isoform X2 [Penaeus japonicus]
MVGFPIAKLGALVIKQVSKPLANVAKTRAKNSHFFRTYVLMPPAQFYHWCEVRMKMYVMNIGRSSQGSTIPRLSEEAAIELGANLLGEGVIFGIAVAILGYEVSRQKEKERKKEQEESDFINSLEQRINDLAFANEELDTKVRELTRSMYATQHQLQIQGRSGTALQMKPHEGQGPNSGSLTRALVDAKNKISS